MLPTGDNPTYAREGIVPDSIQLETPPQVTPLGLRTCLGWGAGSIGSMAMLTSANALILMYFTDILAIPAALAGLIIGATRVFDACTDPLMGTISDRTQSKWGRRRPYLLLGAFLCALAPILLFVMPQWLPPEVLPYYAAIALMLFTIAYTVFTVPYLAMPVEMTQIAQERTYLFTFRMYGFATGNLIGFSLSPWIVGKLGGSEAAYAVMGMTLSGLVFSFCLICFFWTSGAPVAYVDVAKKTPQLKQIRRALENRSLRALLLTKTLLVTGVSVSGGALAFYVTAVMGNSLTILPIIGLSILAGTIVSQPVWLKIAVRLGKRNTYLLGSFFYIFCALSWLLGGPEESLWIFALRGLMFGITTGGTLLTSQSMLPDVLDHEVRRTNTRNEGVLTGLFSTVERGSAALGVAIGGIILGAGGYVVGTAGAVQSESALTAIYICTGVAPAVGCLCSMVTIWFYELRG
jgi:GPH family glycoside/pentoside/hexuronide:cation symporter